MMQSCKCPLLSLVLLILALSNCRSVHGANKIKDVVVVGGGGGNEDAAIAIADADHHITLMGKMFPIFSEIFGRKNGLSFQQVTKAVSELADHREIAILAAVGWGLVPITKSAYEAYVNVTGRGGDSDDITDTEAMVDETSNKSKSKRILEAYEKITPWDDKKIDTRMHEIYERVVHWDGEGRRMENIPTSDIAKKGKRTKAPFRETFLFQLVDHISQASKIGLSVIAVDCVTFFIRMMGYSTDILKNVPRIYSKVVYTGWITHRLQLMKRHFLEKTLVKSYGGDLGKLNVVNDLVDGLLYLGWLFHLLNYLEVHTGIAVKSLFSIGATGTLVFGLASKDIASQLMSGLALHLSDKVYEGDEVRFSDGTSGKIVELGWFETTIRNSDELVVGVPNTQLSGQRVYNLSRTQRSQVQQVVRVSYDDASKIPKFLETIKEEIRNSCPKLITDGSRPFRAHWRNYEDDHLQIVVDAHFMIPPSGNEYWDNRQQMLEAIFHAAKKAGIHLERAAKVA